MNRTVKGALTGAALAGLALLTACTASSTSTGSRLTAPGSGNVEATSPGPATAPHCGIERWAVKTGTDPAAGQVNLADVHDTTVADLAGLAVPPGIEEHPDVRQGAELTVWRIHGILVEYKAEADSDYHLVIKDQAGQTMIVEIPAPACVGVTSPFRDAITHARKQFDQVFTVDGTWHPAGVPVIVTGVGFFDRLHGQTGVARNGIELHPGLDIQIGNPNPPTTTPTPASLRHLRLGERPPECVVVKIRQPAGTAWLGFCGSGPGRESSMRDGASPQIVDGFTALIPPADCTAPGTSPGPCYLFATSSGPS